MVLCAYIYASFSPLRTVRDHEDNLRLMLIILAPVSILAVDSSFGVILGKIVLMLFTDPSVKIGLKIISQSGLIAGAANHPEFSFACRVFVAFS